MKVVPKELEDGCAKVKDKFRNMFSFNDIISPPKRSQLIKDYKLTPEDQFFVAACVVLDVDEDIFCRANAALILGYRAIDIWSDVYIDFSSFAIVSIFKELEKAPEARGGHSVKFNKNHVQISLMLILAQLSIAEGDEKLFSESLVNSLYLVNNNKGPNLKHSYFSLNLIFNFVSLYLEGGFVDKVIEITIELSKLSYSYHGGKDSAIRYKEFSDTLRRLCVLKNYNENKSKFHQQLFNNSLRCSHGEQLYDIYCGFCGVNKKALEDAVNSIHRDIGINKLSIHKIIRGKQIDEVKNTVDKSLSHPNGAEFNLKGVIGVKGLVTQDGSDEAAIKQRQMVFQAIENQVKPTHKSPDILREVALSFEHAGDIETALKIMQKALELRPTGPFIKKKVIEYQAVIESTNQKVK